MSKTDKISRCVEIIIIPRLDASVLHLVMSEATPFQGKRVHALELPPGNLQKLGNLKELSTLKGPQMQQSAATMQQCNI